MWSQKFVQIANVMPLVTGMVVKSGVVRKNRSKIVQIANGSYAVKGLGYGRNDRSVTAVAILVTGIVQLRAGCRWLRACSEKDCYWLQIPGWRVYWSNGCGRRRSFFFFFSFFFLFFLFFF